MGWCTTKNKNELPAARIHRQCNPKAIEVAFLSVPAIEFFAEEQLQVLHERYLREGQGLEPVDATVKDDNGPLPPTFSCMTSGCSAAQNPPGGTVKVVFMVRGSGDNEKPIRKACVVGEFGEHL